MVRIAFRILPCPAACALLCSFVAVSFLAVAQSASKHRDLIVCGGDELFILNVDAQTPVKTWTWKAANRPELPVEMRDKFKTIDDCKPIDGGKRILITASSNGVAVIERATGRVSFYADVPNAHSIELLPGNRLVVAASHASNGSGDRLIIFDLDKPAVEQFQTEASWAHGVVWDSQRNVLWALTKTELRAYRLSAWASAKPALQLESATSLPDKSGHDLTPAPTGSMLAVSTHGHAWLFDRDSREFKPYPELDGHPGIKCIGTDGMTGQTVWVLSEGKNWWSDKLRFLNPEQTITLPGERIYKARWMPRN